MEETVKQLWIFTLWGFGTCATGFFVLLTIVLRTASRMTKPVEDIRDALIGTFNKPGLITRHHDLEKSVEDNKKICKKRHGKAQ